MLDALGTGVASLPEHDVDQPPLGRLLVERGFLTDDQLQHALAEHDRTGLPLGQLLISLSYVTASTIAQVLATIAAVPTDVPPISPAPAPVAPPAFPGPGPTEASTRIESLELELAGARHETMLARRDADLVRQEMLALEQAAAAAHGAESELIAAAGRIQALEAERDARVAELLETQARLASTTQNLRAAYERLHRFEIAEAIEQHRQAQRASRYAWHS
jgi:hypothetical protein